MNHATPELNRLDDHKALARYARTGDPRAFEVLTHRYQAMVLATCRRTLRDLSAAEDAAQETFLTLAHHAAKVRSNVAAWLHATAHRTAIDMLRAQQSQSRAEQAAAVPDSSDATAEEQTWKDLEPELDAALAKLSPEDKELVVSRFLAGRPVTELAKQHGVNKGTMSRRIDRAVKNLRGTLEATGLSIAVGVSLPAVLALSRIEAAPGLGVMLGKVGLMGMTSCGKPALLAGVLSPAVVAAALSVTIIAGSVLTVGVLRSTQSTTTSAPSITAPAVVDSTAPPRPTRLNDDFAMTSVAPGNVLSNTLIFDGSTMSLTAADGWQGDTFTLTMTVSDLTPRKKRGSMTLDVQTVQAEPESEYRLLANQRLKAEYEIDKFGRLFLTSTIPVNGGQQEQTWVGIRPPADHDLAQDAPYDGGNSGLQGPWVEFSDWGLRLDQDNVAITSGRYDIHRFRIIEWEDAGDHARIQAICADSMAPGMVGERVKLLLRKVGNAHQLVYNERNWSKLNQWPTTFEPTSNSQDDNGLLVRTFTEAK